MPTYNVGDFVEETLQSLLGQSMQDWELIVVDDQSTDDTFEILKRAEASDPRIRVHKLAENSGGGFTPRNTAISMASADWIVYLDGDDKIEPDYLLKIRNRIEEEPEAKLLLTRMVISDKNCHPTQITCPESDFDMKTVSDGKSLVKETLVKWNISFGGIAADRLTTLKVIELMKHEPFSSYQDEIMSRYQLIYTRKVAFADAEYFYRTNPSSVTNKPSVKTFDFLHNNIRLAKLTKEYFGIDSVEYQLAQTELYIRIFNKLRTLAHNDFSEGDSKKAKSLIRQSFDAIDWEITKRRISMPRYILTRYFPISLFYWIFKLRLYK